MKMKQKASAIVGDYPTHQSIIVNGSPQGTTKLETANLAESVIGPSNYGNNLSITRNKGVGDFGYSTVSNQYVGSNPQAVSYYMTLEMENTFQKKRN
jgi:hypothetical protein